MPFPIYNLSEFPHGVAEDRFNYELRSLELSVTYLGLVGSGETIDLRFDGSPSQGDIDAVDAVVQMHSGQKLPSVSFVASTKLVETSRNITSNAWELMGGVVTSPVFFDADLEHLVGRVVGEFEADGEIELRLVEKKGGVDRVMCSSPWTLGPATPAEPFQVNTDTPPQVGENSYRLEGRLTTATAAKLYFTSLTLLKVV